MNVAPYPYLTLREARKLARWWNGTLRKEGTNRYSVWVGMKYEIKHHEERYYFIHPEKKTLKMCENHGKDHKASGWSKQIDPRWNGEQVEAYLKGYNDK